MPTREGQAGEAMEDKSGIRNFAEQAAEDFRVEIDGQIRQLEKILIELSTQDTLAD